MEASISDSGLLFQFQHGVEPECDGSGGDGDGGDGNNTDGDSGDGDDNVC